MLPEGMGKALMEGSGGPSAEHNDKIAFCLLSSIHLLLGAVAGPGQPEIFMVTFRLTSGTTVFVEKRLVLNFQRKKNCGDTW